MCATVIRNTALVIVKQGITPGVTDLEMDAVERCEGVKASCEWMVLENKFCLALVLY